MKPMAIQKKTTIFIQCISSFFFVRGCTLVHSIYWNRCIRLLHALQIDRHCFEKKQITKKKKNGSVMKTIKFMDLQWVLRRCRLQNMSISPIIKKKLFQSILYEWIFSVFLLLHQVRFARTVHHYAFITNYIRIACTVLSLACKLCCA